MKKLQNQFITDKRRNNIDEHFIRVIINIIVYYTYVIINNIERYYRI